MPVKMENAETEGGFAEVQFVVEPNYAGWRLDKYLHQKIPRLSRTRLQQIIERDLICDRKLKPSSSVIPGLTFRLRKRIREEPQTPTSVEEIYCDDWLLVLNKPAGLPIHPTARYHRGTVVAVLQEKYGPSFQAWPAHRLDRETSGVLVCGRTVAAARALMSAFAAGELRKEYLAICEGSPPESFAIDAPIALGSPTVRIAVRIDRLQGKPARTSFSVAHRFRRDGAAFALVHALPETGRQHQIRVHLRAAGFPVVGDKIYGPDEGYFDRFSKRCLEREAWKRLRLPRQALHASAIRLQHPGSGAELSFSAPLPQDLDDFIARGEAIGEPQIPGQLLRPSSSQRT